MPRKEPIIEKLLAVLYKTPDEVDVKFTDNELALKHIYEDIFCKWLDKPSLMDKDLIKIITTTYGRSKIQAYRDVAIIKSVLGNVRNASKEWHRYTFIENIKEDRKIAKKDKNIEAMIAADIAYGRFTKLDKDEEGDIDYDQIIPPSFEPSNDVTILGLEKVKNLSERRTALAKKYLYNKDKITEAKIVEDEQ